MHKLFVLACALVLVQATTALAVEFPPVSGMAGLDANRYLFVVDSKAKDIGSPHLLVAQLSTAGDTQLVPVAESWDLGLPNDLEAVAPVPGQPGRFLAAESGWPHGNGWLHYFEVTASSSGWTSRAIGRAALPTWLHGEVEGIALGAKKEGGLVLVIAERGGSGPYTPAWLWWGDYDLGTGAFTMSADAGWGMQLNWPDKQSFPYSRGCSDLYLDDGGYLWAAGAEDLGDDGPFRSVVYRIGRFDANQAYPIMYEYNQDLVWRVDGLKIEAIGPRLDDSHVLIYATDDETFGGLWRPLPYVAPRPDNVPAYGYGG